MWLLRQNTVMQVRPAAPRPSGRRSELGPPAVKGRRVRSIPKSARVLVSVDERGSGRRQDWLLPGCCFSRVLARNGIERMRVTLPKYCAGNHKPADDCRSNKYPLRVSAIDKTAPRLRPDYRRVNRRKSYYMTNKTLLQERFSLLASGHFNHPASALRAIQSQNAGCCWAGYARPSSARRRPGAPARTACAHPRLACPSGLGPSP